MVSVYLQQIEEVTALPNTCGNVATRGLYAFPNQRDHQ